GGAVAIPENALKTVAKRTERTVGADGCFSLNNTPYEVKGLHSAKIYVYEGVFDDKLVVQDKATGEKYEVENFKPNPVGTFTAHPETPYQKNVKAAKSLEVTSTLYSDPIDSGNVTHMPTRVKETRKVENPLSVNADCFDSIREAMRAFTGLSGIILEAGSEGRKAIESVIIENGLNRNFVAELTAEILEEKDRGRCCG
ncbi:hypothetical protein KAH55_01440, partial [bacterium]|nr:hypothetical protein [bacterium]